MNAKPYFWDTYFTCLLPPGSIRERFNAIAQTAPTKAELKRPEDLHISLNYFRVPSKKSVRDLRERLGRIEFPAFDLRLADMDSFFRVPTQNRNTHVAWMRPDGPSNLRVMQLHARILLSLRPVGYTVGGLEIVPHMTALKYPFHAAVEPMETFIADHADLRMPPWRCTEFYLARTMTPEHPNHPSNQDNRGSKYEIIERVPLVV